MVLAILLTMVLFTLKMTDQLNWSNWAVLSPVLAVVVLNVVVWGYRKAFKKGHKMKVTMSDTELRKIQICREMDQLDSAGRSGSEEYLKLETELETLRKNDRTVLEKLGLIIQN